VPESSFRILSLDGGGVRGAFVTGFLAEIERKLGRPVADHFDLLAGTSTGGIIAMGLAVGIPAAQIERFYLDKAVAVFARARLHRVTRPLNWALRRNAARVDTGWIRRSKYPAGPLANALGRVFGERTLDQAARRVVIPAVDLARSQTIVFKTPHLPGMERDLDFRRVDVVPSTTDWVAA
jgi:patatin-like phospholipase/acyl hydrolase